MQTIFATNAQHQQSDGEYEDKQRMCLEAETLTQLILQTRQRGLTTFNSIRTRRYGGKHA